MRSTLARVSPAIAVLASGAVMLAAFGGDDDNGTDSRSKASKASYCVAHRKIDKTFGRQFTGPGAEDQQEQVIIAIFDASKAVERRGLTQDALSAAPERIKADAQVLATAIRKSADEDDPRKLFSRRSDTAAKRLDRFCGARA
jgi:hypothetical protein